MSGKYIIFDWNGLEYPVLLPRIDHFIGHDEIKSKGESVSAGFFSISSDKVTVYGGSTSLQLKSRIEDVGIITKYLTG